VFLTFIITALVVFLGFQVNARIREGIERRDVLCAMACLFAATFAIVYLVPNLWVIAAFFMIGRIGVGLWVFNLYNYTAGAYPTRIRASAFAWTDGLGHLGAWGGVTLLGPLYTLGPNHLGWFLWAIIPGALVPAIVIRTFGIKQSRTTLEQVST
jgi:MFS family permease